MFMTNMVPDEPGKSNINQNMEASIKANFEGKLGGFPSLIAILFIAFNFALLALYYMNLKYKDGNGFPTEMDLRVTFFISLSYIGFLMTSYVVKKFFIYIRKKD